VTACSTVWLMRRTLGLGLRPKWSHAPPQGELASSVAGHAAARQCCAGAASPPAGSAPAAVQLQLKALLGQRQVGDVVQAPRVVAGQQRQVHAAACARAPGLARPGSLRGGRAAAGTRPPHARSCVHATLLGLPCNPDRDLIRAPGCQAICTTARPGRPRKSASSTRQHSARSPAARAAAGAPRAAPASTTATAYSSGSCMHVAASEQWQG